MQNGTLRLTICGAAGTVTGSRYLLEFNSTKLLVDCGLFQGLKELRLRNWDVPPFNPRELAAIVLTHAHIDHTGYLPLVVKRGFSGPIFCTAATKDLLKLLLIDSAHLQEEEAEFANRKGTSKHKPALPLYTVADAERALGQLREIPFGQLSEIAPGMNAVPTPTGHILGAAAINVEAGGKRVSFSGDVGRFDVPLMCDPAPLEIGDLLLCESTYGTEDHPPENPKEELARVINESVKRRGPLIIPAFALGRTQSLLYYLGQLEREGRIPVLPVYVDSPMAVDATRIYREHQSELDDGARALINAGKNPLLTEKTFFCRSSFDSKKLNDLQDPRIIISASGMATGGRILHHLANWIGSPETTVLFVGYQAVGSRGATIQSGSPSVKIFGKSFRIRAKVETISGLSAHAGRSEILRWLKSSSGTPKVVRVIHGEPEQADSLAKTLRSEFGWNALPGVQLEGVEV